MSKIVFLNRYFSPDHSATSQLLSDLAFYAASRNYPVSVVTSRQRYDDPNALLPHYEFRSGVHIHRIDTTRFGRSGNLARALDYISFYGPAFRKIRQISPAGAVLVAKTDPPLLSILGAALTKTRQMRVINWLQDLYPEVAQQIGVKFARGPAFWALARMRDRSLRTAYANVVLGTRMASKLHQLGVPQHQIRIIPNWADEKLISPISHDANPLVKEWGLEGKFVVGYSGNLGQAHEFQTVLEAARLLANDDRIVFLVIGGGAKMMEFKAQVRRSGLTRCFLFLPYQPDNLLKYSLGVPHVHWISLLPKLEGLIVPSKFYGVLAAGRPTIFIGDANGELASIIMKYGLGYVINPGDSQQLAINLAALVGTDEAFQALGRSARRVSETLFAREQALTQWLNLLDDALDTRT